MSVSSHTKDTGKQKISKQPILHIETQIVSQPKLGYI
jgi:hypothetical protein